MNGTITGENPAKEKIFVSETEAMIRKARVEKVEDLKKKKAEIKEKITNLVQKSFEISKFSEREKNEQEVKKLIDEESNLYAELRRAEKEIEKPVSRGEILEFEKKQIGVEENDIVKPKSVEKKIETSANWAEQKELEKDDFDVFIKNILGDKEIGNEQKIVILEEKLSKMQEAIKKLKTPEAEEKKIMTPEDVKAKIEKAKKIKEEREKKHNLLVNFVKKDKERFKNLWFNNRELHNILFNMGQILRKEKEEINKMLQEKDPELVFDLKINFLGKEKLMNEEKETITTILNDNETFPKEQKQELIKQVLKELIVKYDTLDAKIKEIDSDRIMGMDSAFSEVTGKNILDEVPGNNKSAERIDSEVFRKLDLVIDGIKAELETHKKELFSETK